MEWTANDRITQYYNYTCLSKRNIELTRLKTSFDKTCHSEHFGRVVKDLLNINKILKRKLPINHANIRNVIQQDCFLQIPTDHMQKILNDLDEMRFAKRKTLNLLLLKVNSLREKYQNLLMKTFSCRIQADTHDAKAKDGESKIRLVALNLNRCEAAIRNARNIHGYYVRIGNFLLRDNLHNNRSLAALKEDIEEQKVLTRKTILIGRSVIDYVAQLNINLKKSTIGFNASREHAMKSLLHHKAVLSKERSAIVNASMKEIDSKRWLFRYDSMTRSMEELQTKKEDLHSTILKMKYASLCTSELKILSEMDNKTKKIMELETEIYEKETIYKQLNDTIENTKYMFQEGTRLLSPSKDITLALKEEKEAQTIVFASLTRLKSLHMLLDNFFAYIPKIIKRCNTEILSLEDTEYQNKISLLALLDLFKDEE